MSTIVRPPNAPEVPPTPRRRRLGVVAASLVLVVAGAGLTTLALWKDDPAPESRVDAVSGGAPSPAPKTEEQRIVEAVEGFFRVDAEALAIPDPNHPLFTAYLTEPQLSASRDVVQRLADQGLAARPISDSIAEREVTVTGIEGEKATAEVCEVDDGQVVYVESGEPAFDYPEGQASTALFSAELVEEFGSWKIAQLRVLERWEGVAGCAVAAG